MKKMQKIKVITIMAILMMSSLITNISASESGTNDEDSIFIMPPILAYSPKTSNLGVIQPGDMTNYTFQIWNGAFDDNLLDNYVYDPLAWELIVPSDFSDFVSVDPAKDSSQAIYYDKYSGSNIIDKTTVTVAVSTTGMLNGTYTCRIHIDCIRPEFTLENGGDGIFTVSFEVGDAIPNPIDPMLWYNLKDSDTDEPIEQDPQDKKNYNLGLMGKTVDSLILELWNCGMGTLEYNLNVTCKKKRIIPGCGWDESGAGFDCIAWDDFSKDWAEINPSYGESTGEHDLIDITFDTRDLVYNEYRIMITFDTNVGTSYITITFEVGHKLAIDRDEYVNRDDIYRGETLTETFQVWNELPGNMAWYVYVPNIFGYIDVSPQYGFSSGPDDKTTVTVTINTTRKYDVDTELYGPNGGGIRARCDLFFLRKDLYACRPGDHADFLYILDFADSDSIRRLFNSNNSDYFKADIQHRRISPLGDPTEFQVVYRLCECDPSEDYDMLIITTDYLLNGNHIIPPDTIFNKPDNICYNGLWDLKKAHEELDGFNVKMMTVEEIYEKYLNADPLYTEVKICYEIEIKKSTDIDQNNKAIKAFIEDAYKNWNVKYVLLVGDDDWVVDDLYDPEFDYDANPYVVPHFVNLYEQYMEHLDTKWLKLGNIEDKHNSWNSNYVEVPTFQENPKEYNFPASYEGGYDTGEWRRVGEFISELDGNCEGAITEDVTANIQLLYPYKLDSANGETIPRDLYINKIEIYGVPCVPDCCCFPPGTLISMADGSFRNIEDIVEGDIILSFDKDANCFVSDEIVGTLIKNREGVYSINDGLVSPTDDHPLYVRKADGRVGWASLNPMKSGVMYSGQDVMLLEIGDELFTADGWIRIDSIVYHPGAIVTYTFSVDNYHQYFANGVLVSNAPDCPITPGCNREFMWRTDILMDKVEFRDINYKGIDCTKINIKQNPNGLSVDLNVWPGFKITHFEIDFYDSSKYGFDTFILRFDGQEMFRHYDTDDNSWTNPYTAYASIASDYQYTLDGKVSVGRIPASDSYEMIRAVRKTVAYMKAPAEDDYLNALLLSEWLGFKFYPPGNKDPSKPHMIFTGEYKDGTAGWIYDPFLTGDRTQSDAFNIINMHDEPGSLNILNIPGVRTWAWDNVEQSDHEKLIETLNNGVGVINHIGRAERYSGYDTIDYERYTGLSIREKVTRYKNMRLMDYYLDKYRRCNDGNCVDASLKNPVTPFIFSMSDFGGFFDNPGDSMAEWMLGDDRGAVAGIWLSGARPYDEDLIGVYDWAFWDEIQRNGCTMGEALIKTKELLKYSTSSRDIGLRMKKDYYVHDFSWSNNLLKYGMNLFGDPALKIKGCEDPFEEIPPIARDDFVQVNESSVNNTIDVLANDSLPEADGSIFAYNPHSLDLGIVDYGVHNASFDIWNHGGGTIDYSLNFSWQKLYITSAYDNNTCQNYLIKQWRKTFFNNLVNVAVTPLYGSSNGEKDTIKITFDTTDLSDFFAAPCIFRIEVQISYNAIDDADVFYLYFETEWKNRGRNQELSNLMDIFLDLSEEIKDSYADFNLDSLYVCFIDSVTNPVHGSVTFNDSFVEYSPDPGYCGPDSFNYTILSFRDMGIKGVLERSSTATVFVDVNGINTPPIVCDIPDQNIFEGDSFALIYLDDFVNDSENYDNEIIWSYSGNTNLIIDITDRIATVTYPPECIGSETITFTATDGGGLSDFDDATFTVEEATVNLPPVISNEIPVDKSENISVYFSCLSIDIDDPEGDSFDWTIESVPIIFSGGGTGEFNGTKIACSMIDCCMPYNTTITWFVNATDSDSGLTTRAVYSFTTESNPGVNHLPDRPVNPTPLNDLINQSISLLLSVDVFDPDGDNLDVTFYIDDVSVGTDNLVISGQTASIDVELEYNTTYFWYAIADDGQYTNKSDTWVFTTKENNSSDPIEEPAVEIIKPLENMLYVHNELKRNFVMTTIIGDIDIEVVVLDPSGTIVETVKFFLDEDELKSITYDNQATTYSYTLDKRAIGVYTLKVSACDSENKEIVSKELDVIIFYFGIKK